ncbi:MAG: OmpA family protein [Actinomycetota bacterium]|nr:OmpA family protein [Actinomycetota bacterium]
MLVVHHPSDEGVGERVVTALRDRGVDARRPDDPVAAARWSRTVAECQRTRRSRAVVVVAGPALESAPGVRRDVELAREAGRPVLALRTDDASVTVDGASVIDGRDGEVHVDDILARLAVAESQRPPEPVADVPDAFADDDGGGSGRWRWLVPAVGGPLVIALALVASSAFAADDDGVAAGTTTTTGFLVDVTSAGTDGSDTTGTTTALRATTTVAGTVQDPASAPVTTTAATAPPSPELRATQLQDQIDALLAARPLSFEIGSTSLTAESMDTLDDLVALLTSEPGLAIEVGGHTDDNGEEASNLTISQLRADAVVAQLVNRGVDAARLTSVGYGESLPIADNTTSDGRAANRRIELTVLTQGP